jgi:hypothetical protein
MWYQRALISGMSLAVLIGSGIAWAADVRADANDDAVFFDILEDGGYPYDIDNTEIALAQKACHMMTENGENGLATFIVVAIEEGMTPESVTTLVAGAVVAYCPDHLKTLRDLADKTNPQAGRKLV